MDTLSAHATPSPALVDRATTETGLTEIASPAAQAALGAALGLLNASPLPMLLWSGEHTLPQAGNLAFTLLLTDTRSPWQASAWAPEAWAQVQADVAQVRRTGQVVWRENQPLPLPCTPAGEFRGTFSYNPVLADGRIAGVLFMCTRHYRESTVHEDRRFGYAALVHSMDLGFAIVEALETPPGQLLDYRFVEVNRAWEVQTGFQGVQGKRISELTDKRDPFWPEIIERVLRTGQSERAVNTNCGEGCALDVFMMRLGGPYSRQAAMLVRDISAQTQALQALQRSEKRARAEAARADSERKRLDVVLETTPAPMFVVDAQGRFVRANSRARQEWGRYLHSDSRSWVGWWADGSPRHGQRLSAQDWPLARALRGEAAHDVIEMALGTGNAQRKTYLVSGAPIRGQDDEVEGAVVTATDITAQVQAERALQESHRRKDEFLAMLAHELRNPLAPIGAAAELMGRPSAGKDLMARTSAIITRQVRHMTGLVDDLLDMSRVSRGTITLDKEFLDTASVLNDAIEQVTPLLRARRHQLEVVPPPRPLLFEGDRKRIVQVLSNLLNNAIKYTPEGGHIQLCLTHEDRHLEIRVKDNGQGMDHETLAHAFELFSQARRTSDRQQGGLGIGLALVKKLVELHGGAVSASSPGIGQGSEFSVRLPTCDAASVTPGPTRAVARKPARSLQVLVVDDHVDGALTLSMLIEAEGYACRVLHDPAQALELAGRAPPDACVLDIGLPGMDGRELARRLRKQPAMAQCLLIALSGYAQARDREAALTAGFDHYLVKPVDSNGLMELLAQRAAQLAGPPLAA